MKKQFFRVKQIADQTFLRAEKSEVLSEELQNVEKRVELIKQVCQTVFKKMTAFLSSVSRNETSVEKKMKKMPEVVLSTAMLELSQTLKEDSILGYVLGECSQFQDCLAKIKLSFELEAEAQVLQPIATILEVDLPNIAKIRKQLNKLRLDMDSARTRYVSAVRHSQQLTGTALVSAANKVEQLKEEMEEASSKVDQTKDCLAAEMLALVSREPEISELIRLWYRLQASYHRDVLDILECSLPPLEAALEKCPQKPVFGLHLSQHLSTSDRQIAWVLEACVCFLLEWGLCEEGLFRIAGGSSKVKKLKNSFDCGLVDMTDYLKDPHAVAGVLKSYLRELPDPLLTPELYDEWLAATKVPDSNDRLQALWTVLHKLPAPNFQNLRYLVKFLSKLAANNDVNKMSSQNLAIVLAPNLIWAPKEDINTPLGLNMNVANMHTSLVETLISYCNWFFPEEVEFYQTLSPGWLDHHKPTNGELEIDLSSDSSPRVVHKPHKKPAPPAPQPEPLEQPPAYATLERPEKPERTSIQVKSSTENLAVGYKPAVPERPIPYSTMSLERPVKVRGGNKGDRAEVRLSVIERPSVPPPARPADPPVPSGIALSSTLSFVDESDPEEDIPVSDRWDFLHNSGGHIPPDRPPRSHEEPPKPRARTVPPVPPPVKPKPLPSPTTESPPTQC